MFKKVYLMIILLGSGLVTVAQNQKQHWVDSIMSRLKLEEKIGQLFVLRVAPSKPGKAQGAERLIQTYHVGGVILEPIGSDELVEWTGRFQQKSDVPLLIGLQYTKLCSWLPGPLALSALRDDTLRVQAAKAMAIYLKRSGIQLYMNPLSEYYQAGSPDLFLGDEEEALARRTGEIIRTLKNEGILAIDYPYTRISQIPGDTSRLLPETRLDSNAFRLMRKLITTGLAGVVTSQYGFFVKEKKKSIPIAASPLLANYIFGQHLAFKGLFFSNIHDLQNLYPRKSKGDVENFAFLIGNDMLIDPLNLPNAIKRIAQGIRKDSALARQLNKTVIKILNHKYDAGLAIHPQATNMDFLQLPETRLLQHQVAEQAVTLVKNDDDVLPIRALEDKQFLSLSLGDSNTEFDFYLSQYAPVERWLLRKPADTSCLAAKLSRSYFIFVQISDAQPVSPDFIHQLERLSSDHKVIVCNMGRPHLLKSWKNFPVLLQIYQPDALLPQAAAQIIFGGIGSRGVLPVTVDESLKNGHGLISEGSNRLGFSVAEAVGMDSKVLDRIPLIASEAIDSQATPGCRVLVARYGKVIYDQSFGYLTYENKIPVQAETIYDLASLTKVSATLQAVMFMQEHGLIDINKKISVYLPELKGSNKEDFTIKDILTHQAGLWPFLPFWATTMKDTAYLSEYYRQRPDSIFTLTVSKNLYATRAMKDSLWHWIIRSRIIDKNGRTPFEYKYSDMGFYIMQHLAEKILNQPMEEFLNQFLFEPLGAYTTGYQPLKRFPESRIAPTENDKLFRKSLLVGFVHDQGAAMHGGIAGHAGLFSSAVDLAKLGQMWLNGGSYGGHRYFRKETLKLFTGKHYETSRRGLGWDRPVASDPDGPTSLYASQRTFGHTGFTGTCIWVDPEFDLVYVFLSNRVYPAMTNNKILSANIRPRIQELIYKSIFSYCRNHP